MSTAISKNARTPLLEIQGAVFQRLSAELDTPVYDYVPESAPYPYVVIGEATEIPDNTLDNFGRETTLTLHIWTQGRQGFVDALTISNEIQEILDHQRDLSLTNHRIVVIKLDQVLTMKDPDPTIRHVPMRFRICTEQN